MYSRDSLNLKLDENQIAALTLLLPNIDWAGTPVISNYDFRQIILRMPQTLVYLNPKSNIYPVLWMELLRKYPYTIEYFNKYRGWEKFSDSELLLLAINNSELYLEYFAKRLDKNTEEAEDLLMGLHYGLHNEGMLKAIIANGGATRDYLIERGLLNYCTADSIKLILLTDPHMARYAHKYGFLKKLKPPAIRKLVRQRRVIANYIPYNM